MQARLLAIYADFAEHILSLVPLQIEDASHRPSAFPNECMSRIAGWTAHVYEQQSDNRLIRPLANYTGGRQLPWVPIEQR